MNKLAISINSHTSFVNNLHKMGNTLISSSDDETIKLFDISNLDNNKFKEERSFKLKSKIRFVQPFKDRFFCCTDMGIISLDFSN